MTMIHLVEGPVGAGKSTFAARLSRERGAPRLILDEWMATLFRADRPQADFLDWYVERKQRCVEQIWRVSSDLMDTGTSVILELGLIRRQEREDFYGRIDAAGYPLAVYLLEVPKEVRRERVRRRNAEQGATFQMVVSDEVFELASSLWEPPDDVELSERKIEIVR